MIKKLPLVLGLEFLIGRECQFSLGIYVYSKISMFANNHYVVKFYVDEVPYIVRDLWIRGNKAIINFPTQKQLLKAIRDKKKQDKKKQVRAGKK